MTPSPLQAAILSELSVGHGNICVRSCAGSGKSTVIVEGTKVLPPSADSFLPPCVTVLAFNKDIATSMSARVPRHVCVSTFHSLGLRALKSSGRVARTAKVDGRKVPRLVWNALDFQNPDCASVIKLVALAKTVWPQPNAAALRGLVDRYDLDFQEERAALAAAESVLRASSSDLSVLDFDDMLYLPVLLGVEFDKQDYVFVDEAQDTNDIQLEILERLDGFNPLERIHGGRPATRFVFVGDPHQAIYGFRGANSDSMTRIATRFSCKTFPLDVSYRCPQAIVAEAQKYLKD